MNDILKEEPLIPVSKKHYLVSLINSKMISKALELKMKIVENKVQDFKLSKQLKAHHQPLTNCAFNKGGDQYL